MRLHIIDRLRGHKHLKKTLDLFLKDMMHAVFFSLKLDVFVYMLHLLSYNDYSTSSWTLSCQFVSSINDLICTYLLLPNQYAIRPAMGLGQSAYIFDGVGIMLYGKASFCIKFTKLIRHGGGRAFKTLHWLVKNLNNQKVNIGAIVVEDMGWATRHLKQCASEYKLNMMSANWIIGSLLSRKVLPFDTNDTDLGSTIKEAGVEIIDSSQEM